MHNIVKNQYGFYELKVKPNSKELKEYYANKYYLSDQEKINKYQKEYSPDELTFINNRCERKFQIIKKEFPEANSLLDVGCGEGFTLQFFKKKKWKVTGLEFQSDACHLHNKDVANEVVSGDVHENLIKASTSNEKFDVIVFDNVLEHVIDPESIINATKKLMHKSSILIIEAPNDFSLLQKTALEKKLISTQFWVTPPDHLNYFDKVSLNNFLNELNLQNIHFSCDYPIDFNIFNPDTNYVNDKSKGKNVHLSRVLIENLLDSISVDKTNVFYEALADLGLGRNIIGYYKLSK